MSENRVWRWNLEEMRNAESMKPDQVPQSNEYYPMVSGFTPISRPHDLPPIEAQSDQTESKAKTVGKAKAPKRRKTQPSTSTSTLKPRKTSGSKGTKRTKTTGQLQYQDISEGLPRTKAKRPSVNILDPKSTALEHDIQWEGTGKADAPLTALTEPEDRNEGGPTDVQLRLPGLVDTDHTAYAAAKMNGVDPSFLTRANCPREDSDQVIAEDDSRDLVIARSCQQWIGPTLDTQPESSDGGVFQAFSIPPSAQEECEVYAARSSVTLEDSGKALSEKVFNSDEIFNDADKCDDFPVGDEGLEEIMQTVLMTEEGEISSLGWQPQDIIEEPVHLNEVVNKDPRFALHDGPAVSSSQPKSPSSCGFLSQTLGNAVKVTLKKAKAPEKDEDCFDDDGLDEDLADLTVFGSKFLQPQTPLTSPQEPSTPKLQWMPPKMYTPVRSSKVPASPTDIPPIVPVNSNGGALPFTRPPFPKPTRDRSPILGLSSRVVLRTCFRIGEALNAASVASRSNTDAIIELYARIIASEREANGGFKQIFQFGDLFTDKPPYLSATYNLWKGVELWDVDSRVFIGEAGKGRMARVMGRIKRLEQGGGCQMAIVSIWEVDWEDVGVAKGIVCS